MTGPLKSYFKSYKFNEEYKTDLALKETFRSVRTTVVSSILEYLISYLYMIKIYPCNRL